MIYVISGRYESGKDKFVELVRDVLQECEKDYPEEHQTIVYNISSIDKIKEVGYVLGWNGSKDQQGRKFLSDLKKLSDQYDGSMKYLRTELDGIDIETDIVFIHIREKDNIDKFKAEYPDTKTILVQRHQFEAGNDSDDLCEDYDYDIIIPNEYGINLLRFEAIKFLVNQGFIDVTN